jgi:hypothetical protein
VVEPQIYTRLVQVFQDVFDDSVWPRILLHEAFGRGLTSTWFAFTLFWFWCSWERIGSIITALSKARRLGVWLVVWLFATAVLASWEDYRSDSRRGRCSPVAMRAWLGQLRSTWLRLLRESCSTGLPPLSCTSHFRLSPLVSASKAV